MNLALEEAEITADQVDYVNMHATSTPNGDESEIKALDAVFEKRSSLLVSGTKSMTGHLLGVAGAVEAVLRAEAINQLIVPLTITRRNLEAQDKNINNFPLEAEV